LQCFNDKVFTSQADPKIIPKKLDDGQLWHRRFGHLNRASMNLLKNGLVTGCDFNDHMDNPCECCLMGKQCRLPFPSSAKISEEILAD